MADAYQAVRALNQDAQQGIAAGAQQFGNGVLPNSQSFVDNTQQIMQQRAYSAPTEGGGGMDDYMQLAMKAQQQRAQTAGGWVSPQYLMDDIVSGKYIDQAAAQRAAMNANDYNAVTNYQQSNDPLLDALINWEYPSSGYMNIMNRLDALGSVGV